jgi:hypothetical protein
MLDKDLRRTKPNYVTCVVCFKTVLAYKNVIQRQKYVIQNLTRLCKECYLKAKSPWMKDRPLPELSISLVISPPVPSDDIPSSFISFSL